MGKGGRILAIELGISMAIVVWSATKRKYWPWPPNVNRTAVAYAVLGILAVASEEMAALLGAGFLLAQVLKTPVDANGNFKFTGGVPPQGGNGEFAWYYLTWGRDPEAFGKVDKKVKPGSSGPNRPITQPPGVVTPGGRDGSVPIQA